ncbi:MAG: DUF4302 domain-containing protein [Sodaliphilus sp.]|nr:DUF4302 domain-containing protein [Muribaculaceae bacterium]MCI6334309.1 DUF4302 domain-containing protein [Bacteroidales bacterium]MDY4461460.1 DUF4302 domain-containing protein [Sodaliphilus sp.]MCI7032935.1 DUF4302 domain-containing protein [Bacteroidales bacterium]MDY5316735.1 DUF4302 domain-containing protein [Sodaliphilus sp.]
MMKKLYKFSAIAAVLMSASLASCNHEEADIFDQNAAHRTEEARKMYKEILLDKGGKWQMEYFTTEEEHGYVYLFSFRNDGTVTISGNNEYITKLTNIDSNVPSYGSETSMWTILSDNGPVLSFNSYNTIFHLFATPEDIPGTERDEQGYGHSGDYEFDLMKFSNDTLYLEGKKNGAEIIMTRIAPEIDDETYLNEVVALADSFFNAKVPAVYVNLPGGYRHVVLDGATQLPKFYPETGDYITEYVGRNAIITHDGFTLGKPLTLRDSIDGNDYTIQHFIRQKDGSLLCTDDNRITITADALNKVVGDERLLWRVNAADCKGELGTAFAGLNTGFKAYNGSSLVHFNIGLNVLNNTKSPYTMVVRIKTKRGSYLNMSVPYTVEYIGKDEIKFVLGEMDSNMKTFIDKVPAFKTMMNKLASSTFKCSSNSLIAPVNMVLTDSSDASSALGISIQ